MSAKATPDKFREECGVVAIYGHPEASKLAYLGLYALQHRGQESAGICTSDGTDIYTHKAMSHVADIFPPVLGQLPGELAIGHTRYSTAGDTVILNAQPFSVACNRGRLAVAHNGNITNATELRAQLERRGAIFQASSESVNWLLARMVGGSKGFTSFFAGERPTVTGKHCDGCFADPPSDQPDHQTTYPVTDSGPDDGDLGGNLPARPRIGRIEARRAATGVARRPYAGLRGLARAPGRQRPFSAEAAYAAVAHRLELFRDRH